MKLSLRNKYFTWLLLLMLAIYFSMAVVLTGMEIHEAQTQGTKLADDIPELIAFLLVMLVTLPAALILAWHISGRLLRPLRLLLATAERIRSGNLNERVPLPSDHELARLAGAINQAFDQYAVAVKRLESFSADASHQLRTPMAAIRTTAEVALQQPRTVADYEEALSDILDQTDRLNRTVEQLLLLARIDQFVQRDVVPLTLADLLQSWFNEAVELFEARTLSWHLDPSCAVWTLPGNAILLRQCFDNLMNNAVAATRDTGRITIRLHRMDAVVQWIMEDDGPGIPESERAMVFERFYRGKASTDKGSGLGLAIVKEIVKLHGGQIDVAASEHLGGAAIIMSFPASR